MPKKQSRNDVWLNLQRYDEIIIFGFHWLKYCKLDIPLFLKLYYYRIY